MTMCVCSPRPSFCTEGIVCCSQLWKFIRSHANMPIICLSFVGKTNEPVFVCTNDGADESESLQLHSIVHCGLDIIDEKRSKKTPSYTPSTDMFLGHLYAVEDYKVFGYCTNTMTKIIAVCDSNTSDADLTATFVQLHDAFVAAIQNPFQQLGHPLTSTKFQNSVKQIIKNFNTVGNK